MKRSMIILLLIAMLILAGCNKKQKENNSVETVETAVTETTVDIPGLEDDFFDENGNVNSHLTVYDGEEKATESTEDKPASSIPQGPSNPNGGVLKDTDSSETSNTPAATKPAEKETESTQPTEKTPEPTKPAENVPKPTEVKSTEYEKFQAMSPSEQQSVMESYENIQDFFQWYEGIKKEHDEANPPIYVDGGAVDLNKAVEDKN